MMVAVEFTIQKTSRVYGFYYNATILGLHNMEIDTTSDSQAGSIGEGYLSLKSDGANVGSAGIISEHPGIIHFVFLMQEDQLHKLNKLMKYQE